MKGNIQSHMQQCSLNALEHYMELNTGSIMYGITVLFCFVFIIFFFPSDLGIGGHRP